ncbi:MAG TPA: HNH endonuclease [Candidatus Bathyarchaeia archaeon]|nr:HNH endonuclease [Candidatus Bathyarchaeia archaeon]
MFSFNPAPKPNHKRRIPKRRERGRIKPETYAKVFERDKGKCVLCGRIDGLEAHHVIYRSQLGKGTEDNIVMLCFQCHHRAHTEPKKYKPKLFDYLKKFYPGGTDDEKWEKAEFEGSEEA